MLRALDFLAIEYDQLGAVRTRSGNRSQYAAPGNIYRTARRQVGLDRRLDAEHLHTAVRRARPRRAPAEEALRRQPRARAEPQGARRDRRRGDRARLTLAELRERAHRHEVGFSPIYDHRRRLRRSAVRRARGDRRGARQRARLGAHAGRGAALLRDARRGAARRPALGEHNDEIYRRPSGWRRRDRRCSRPKVI